MKIAQVAPLFERVPPKMYGGTERVVSYLTEELINMNHDVTLFASGDSITNAKLVSPCDEALRLSKDVKDPLAYTILQLEQIRNLKDEFDLIHFHIDFIHYPFSKLMGVPNITTLHGRLDLPDLQNVYKSFYDMPVISISNAQRKPLPYANWVGTVYNGIPENLLKFHPAEGKYLAFLGRISPEKGIERAIEIAKKAGIKLMIAAKVDPVDKEYFDNVISPLLNNPLIEFVGEINEKEKNDFLGNSIALLFPIDWPEPFGLVMIESFACGTPVIAYNRGSVSEIVEDGVNGFIVNSVEEAVDAINKLYLVSRKQCRKTFESKYTSKIMAENYLNCYEVLVDIKTSLPFLKNESSDLLTI